MAPLWLLASLVLFPLCISIYGDPFSSIYHIVSYLCNFSKDVPFEGTESICCISAKCPFFYQVLYLGYTLYFDVLLDSKHM